MKMHRARAALTLARRDFPAEQPITMGRKKAIKQIAQLPDTGDVIQIRDPTDDWPRGDGLHGRLESGIEPAIGSNEKHLLHAVFVRQTGILIERAWLLEIHALHRPRPGHSDQSPRAGVANRALAVVKDDIAAGR